MSLRNWQRRQRAFRYEINRSPSPSNLSPESSCSTRARAPGPPGTPVSSTLRAHYPAFENRSKEPIRAGISKRKRKPAGISKRYSNSAQRASRNEINDRPSRPRTFPPGDGRAPIGAATRATASIRPIPWPRFGHSATKKPQLRASRYGKISPRRAEQNPQTLRKINFFHGHGATKCAGNSLRNRAVPTGIGIRKPPPKRAFRYAIVT